MLLEALAGERSETPVRLVLPEYCLSFISSLLSGGILVILCLWSCVTFDDKTQTLNRACPVACFPRLSAMLGQEEQLKGYEECDQTKSATTFVRLKKGVAAGVIAEDGEVQAAEPAEAAAAAPVAPDANAAAVCPGEAAAATIPKEDEETPAGGAAASGEEDIAAAGISLAQQLQQLQQRLSAMRWGSSIPLSHPQQQQQKQQQRQQENAGHSSSLSCNTNSNTGSAAGSDSGSESEAEPETVGGIPAATSLGSLVMSLAASAANSVAEKIGQSAQQLFRPSGQLSRLWV